MRRTCLVGAHLLTAMCGTFKDQAKVGGWDKALLKFWEKRAATFREMEKEVFGGGK